MMGKFLHWLQEHIKHWAKPATPVLAGGLLSDLTRSCTDLLVENALLRQKLIILNRQVKRPRLTNPDRIHLVLLSHFTKFWKQTILIIQPETLMRRHRELFSMYWWVKSKSKKSKSKISSETIALIQWYIFVVMELKTRRIVHTGVTKYPTDEWATQQLREATPWGRYRSI
jgi:hypothetical protein